MNRRKTQIFVLAILFLLAPFHAALAAVMYVVPAQDTFALGEEFTIDLRIDSEGAPINAAQATIHWTRDTIELIEAEKVGSTFNHWIDETQLITATSSLHVVGGTTKGISGAALQMIKITFKTKGYGNAHITITDAEIAASDGRGTNVLSHVKNAEYWVGKETPKLPDAGIELPQIVARQALPATDLPEKPNITVPLYGDPAKWNNNLGELTGFWGIPGDVTAVAAMLDHNPNSMPTLPEKELTTGKNFGVLSDGVWFLHARLKNDLGFGPTAHYRILLDTAPPLPFEIVLPEGASGDKPTTTLAFSTSDELSGLKEYHLRIDNKEVIQLSALQFPGIFVVPALPPGKHHVVVRAFDLAENSVEDDVTIEILPITSPLFTFVTDSLFTDEESALTVKGSAAMGLEVLLELAKVNDKEKQEVIVKSIAQVDESGSWEFAFDDTLRSGTYAVYAQSRDMRGALSFVVMSPEVRVSIRPIITVGPIAITKGGVALTLLLVLIMSIGGLLLFYKKQEALLERRVQFTESETTKIFTLISKDVASLSGTLETPASPDVDYALTRLKLNIKNMEGYLKKGIEKIKR